MSPAPYEERQYLEFAACVVVSAVIVGALRDVAARNVLAMYVADQSVAIVETYALSVGQVRPRASAQKNDVDVQNDPLVPGKRKRMRGERSSDHQ